MTDDEINRAQEYISDYAYNYVKKALEDAKDKNIDYLGNVICGHITVTGNIDLSKEL